MDSIAIAVRRTVVVRYHDAMNAGVPQIERLLMAVPMEYQYMYK